MNNGYTPVILSIRENSNYAKFLDNADGNKYLQATAVNLTMSLSPECYFVSPAFNGSSAARDAMAELLKNAFRNDPSSGKTASDMIKELFDKAEKDLKRKYDKYQK
jgi:hypothetical protein